MRNIIVHYHFYKNAGTSIDRILEDSFKGRWLSCDVKDISLTETMKMEFYRYTGEIGLHTRFSTKVLETIIDTYRDRVAFSGHQFSLPFPENSDKVFPIFFLRHPVSRLISGILFETREDGDLLNSDGCLLRSIVREKFADERTNAFANFQALRLGNTNPDIPGESFRLPDAQILSNCRHVLESVPFFGIVEQFGESLRQMHDYLSDDFPEIKIENHWLNRSRQEDDGARNRLEVFREIVGNDIYVLVEDRNRLDMQLYQFALEMFSERAASAKDGSAS